MTRHIVSLVLVALVLVACGGDDPDGASPDAASPAQAPSGIEGVIVSIDAERLGEVTSFDVKDGDAIYTLFIDPAIEYSFPLGHLHEHLETAEPVSCKIEERDGKLFAQTIDDA